MSDAAIEQAGGLAAGRDPGLLVEPSQQQGGRQDQCRGVGDPLSGDVGCGAVQGGSAEALRLADVRGRRAVG